MEKEKSNKFYYQRSFFGPILLVAVGVLFLGINLGLIPGASWGTIWKLWPMLLIVAGFDDLIRRKGIAWPLLLIGGGILLLYNYYGPQSWVSWTQLIQFWPLFLIAAGIDVLFRDQSGWLIATGVVLTLALIAGSVWLFSAGIEIPAQYTGIRENYSETSEYAEIDLALGLGELIISDQDSDQVLIEGNLTPSSMEDLLEQNANQVLYHLKNNNPDFYPHTPRWELDLTNQLELDLFLKNGVGEMLLRLDGLMIDDLAIHQAVGRIVVGLPDSISGEILVKQALGSIWIEIPPGTRVAIDAQNGLSRINFPSDFELDNGFYTSPGAAEANADLLLVVEQAVGLVTVQYAR